MAIPAGIIIGWPSTAGSIPSGWTRVTALDGKYLKSVPNTATEPGSTGGSASHTHTTSNHTHGLSHSHTSKTSLGAADVPRSNTSPTTSVAAGGHTHSFAPGASVDTSGTTDPGMSSQDNEQSNLATIWIESDGTPTTIPSGAVALFGDPSLPGGWSLHGSSGARYLKGAAAAGNGGGTGAGNASHTHTIDAHAHFANHDHPTAASSGPSATVGLNNFTGETGGILMATASHTHQANPGDDFTTLSSGGAVATPSFSNEPSFHTLGAIVSPGEAVPTRLIAVWMGLLANIPTGWALCDGNHGTPDLRDKFIKCASIAGDISSVGGAQDHGHGSGASHTHAGPSHTHTQVFGSASATTTVENFVGSTDGSTAHSTSHNVSTNSASFTSGSSSVDTNTTSDTRPPFTEVAFIQFVGIYVDAVVSASGGEASLTGLAGAAGMLLVAVSFDRASTGDAVFTAADGNLDSAVVKVGQVNTLSSDPDHRRNMYMFLGVIPEGVTDTTIDIDNIGGNCSWIALIVNVFDISLADVTSDDSGTSTTASQGTGSTGQISAGDVLLVAAEVARGDTTAVWTTTDNTPPHPDSGDWDLTVGASETDVHGSLGVVYLEAQSEQTYSDTVTYGTVREASAMILALPIAGDIVTESSSEGTLSATITQVGQPVTGIVLGDGTVLYGYKQDESSELVELGPPLIL